MFITQAYRQCNEDLIEINMNVLSEVIKSKQSKHYCVLMSGYPDSMMLIISIMFAVPDILTLGGIQTKTEQRCGGCWLCL